MGDYSNYSGAEWYLGEGEGEVLISNLILLSYTYVGDFKLPCGKITLVSSFSNKLHLKFETTHWLHISEEQRKQEKI